MTKRADRTGLAHERQAAWDFQRAKTPAGTPPFLQIVAKPKRAAARDKREAKLTRVAFRVSRLMEFCTRGELQNQTGHSIEEWPLVVAKELIDNVLDACEEAEVAPVITVTVEPGVIIIEDNGDGIDVGTVASVLDYSVRVSSREAYCAPTRGAQGNALKTILAMGYVIAGQIGRDAEAAGVTIVEAHGVKHWIQFCVDHINNQPKIIHTTTPSEVVTGTRFTVQWPTEAELLRPLRDQAAPTAVEQAFGPYPTVSLRFRELVEAYAWLNPHLTLRGVFFGREFVNVAGRTGRNGDRAIRPARIGTTRPAYSAISSRPCPATSTSGRLGRFARSSRNLAASPEPASSARSSTRSAARINRWPISSASSGSTRPASPSSSRR